MNSYMSNNLKYFLTALSIAAVAVAGSLCTSAGQAWYALLETPSQWPPPFLFPVVWSAIYLLTFFAVCACIKQDAANLQRVLISAGINGILNVLWCLFFFALKLPFAGQIVILLNLAASIWLVYEIFLAKKPWAWPMLLYPFWVSIATTLNLAIWILN